MSFLTKLLNLFNLSSVGGLEEETDYEYQAKDGLCEFDTRKTKATVKDVFNVTEGDEDQLAVAVAYFNPVSIAFEVNLQNYGKELHNFQRKIEYENLDLKIRYTNFKRKFGILGYL